MHYAMNAPNVHSATTSECQPTAARTPCRGFDSVSIRRQCRYRLLPSRQNCPSRLYVYRHCSCFFVCKSHRLLITTLAVNVIVLLLFRLPSFIIVSPCMLQLLLLAMQRLYIQDAVITVACLSLLQTERV